MRHGTPLTATICVAEVLSLVGFATFPALMPTLIREWHLSNTNAGWINGIFFLGYLGMVPILSSLTDRISPRRVYLLGLALTCLTSMGFALLANGFWTALLFRLVAGTGLAGTYMPGLKLLSDHMEGRPGQSRAVAFYTASMGIGVTVSFALSGEAAELLGWRGAFGVAALGPVLAGVLLTLGLPRQDPQIQAKPETHLLDFRPVLRSRAAMAYVLGYTAHNFELFALRSWIVAFLVFARSPNPEAGLGWSATVLAAIINLVGLPASVTGNELASRFGRHRVITVVMLASAATAGLLGFAAAWPFWVLVVLCVLYSTMVAGDSASLTAGVVEAAPMGYRGATMAVYSCLGFTGAFVGPLVLGLALDLTGGGDTVWSWGVAFACVGLGALIGTAALVVLGRHRTP